MVHRYIIMTDQQSPRERFGIRFAIVARRWRREMDYLLLDSGLTDATWLPLIHLSESGGGITQKHLAALVGIDGSSLVRLLDILVRHKMVERRVDPDDGRARRIHLTELGEARVAEIRAGLAGFEQSMLAGIPDEEIATMLRHLATIDSRLWSLREGIAEEEAQKRV